MQNFLDIIYKIVKLSDKHEAMVVYKKLRLKFIASRTHYGMDRTHHRNQRNGSHSRSSLQDRILLDDHDRISL